MKKLVLILGALPFLLATTCEPEDVPCGNNIQIAIDDLISIENNETSYELGDTLWINSVVSRNQSYNNNAIDLFEYDDKLFCYAELKKISKFEQEFYIYLYENVLVNDIGESFTLIKNNDQFINRTGIKLLEEGNYKLRISSIDSYNSNYDCTGTRVYIDTNILNSDSDKYYYFNVE